MSVDLSERLRELLGHPESYPHHPDEVIVRETHISWVFLVGPFAYKLKKPVALEFLDYGTPERRREMCREEVRLNRRLAPDIYLGVRGLVLDDSRLEFVADDDIRAVEFVVEMRRYEERDTLASRLSRGEVRTEQVKRVGRALARFHAHARPVHDVDVPVMAVERRFERNLQELVNWIEQRGEIERAQALDRFAHAFLTRHAALLHRRAAEGWVREGHGDLRAEHVLVDGTVDVVDCVEFDPALRQLDVAEDLAFLVLDLAAHGGEHLCELLVGAYRDAGGNPGDDRLINFYAAYRALVRAKVALIRASQLPEASSDRARESACARELIAVAERFAWRARLPLVLVVCGPPASGKSVLARALAEVSGLPHLSSDLTRKQLAGVASIERAPGDHYTQDWNERTYAELGRRSAVAVAGNGGAVVDATFRHLGDRRAYGAAFDRAAPLLFVECQAPRVVVVRRAQTRERDPARVSDADVAVVAREFAAWEPLDEVPASAHLSLRTDRPPEEIVGDVMALLDRRLMSPS
jgi:aminoglycoside phosphotransferase family enzyme/predicted kinase